MRLSNFVVHELTEQTRFTNATVTTQKHLEEVIVVFGHLLAVSGLSRGSVLLASGTVFKSWRTVLSFTQNIVLVALKNNRSVTLNVLTLEEVKLLRFVTHLLDFVTCHWCSTGNFRILSGRRISEVFLWWVSVYLHNKHCVLWILWIYACHDAITLK